MANILFLHAGAEMYGADKVMLDLIKRLDKTKFTPVLAATYSGNEASYPSYDNYPAINIDRVASIPIDYCGPMGVPITFLNKFFPSSTFEVFPFIKIYLNILMI